MNVVIIVGSEGLPLLVVEQDVGSPDHHIHSLGKQQQQMLSENSEQFIWRRKTNKVIFSFAGVYPCLIKLKKSLFVGYFLQPQHCTLLNSLAGIQMKE